jgi:predicted nucleotidyltransferase
MLAVCALDPGARAAILQQLKELAAGLKRDFAVQAVYVFGSFARADEHEGSDIDLLVVGNLPGRAPERVGHVLSRTNLPVEPVVVRPETLERHCAAGHPFYTRALREAVRLD